MTSGETGQGHSEGEWVQQAWAKINLGLKILGRRDDGYHDICSIAQTIDLADRLHIRLSDPAAGSGAHVNLTCSDPTLSTGPDNLVRQAIRLFESRLSVPPRPLNVHLDKAIPLGAGLGGGSADAAAVLRAMNIIYGEPLKPSELTGLAAQLGSDVPFQLAGGTALMRGRGERLESLSFAADVHYVLVYPGIHIGSAWAYQNYTNLPAPAASGAAEARTTGPEEDNSLTVRGAYLTFVASLSGGYVDHNGLFECLENDFRPLVERTYPIVATLSSFLLEAGALASSLSGSGSTVFGIYDDRTAAHEAKESLVARGYRSFLCQPVDAAAGAVTEAV